MNASVSSKVSARISQWFRSEGRRLHQSLPILTRASTSRPGTSSTPTEPGQPAMAFRRLVLPGYLQALRIPLWAGRDFSAGDHQHAPRTMVINERMAHALSSGRDPLGRTVAVDMFNRTITFEVVGVVGDARIQSVGDEVPMTRYLSYYLFPDATLRFAIRTDQEPGAMVQTVRRLVQARDHTVPVENLVTMERIVGESLAPQQATAPCWRSSRLPRCCRLRSVSMGCWRPIPLPNGRARSACAWLRGQTRGCPSAGDATGRRALVDWRGHRAGLCGRLTRLLDHLLFGCRPPIP